jgi:hypothetical protein
MATDLKSLARIDWQWVEAVISQFQTQVAHGDSAKNRLNVSGPPGVATGEHRN